MAVRCLRTPLAWLHALLLCCAFSAGAWAAPAADGIVISGASGQLGSEVARALLQRGVAPGRLILISRTPDKLKDFAAMGAIVRAGDFNDAASLPAAFAGGRTLLLISTDTPGAHRVAQHQAAIDAAKAAGIRRIVYTSIVDAGDHSPEDMFADHLKTEAALKRSGLKWTILRNQVYADLQLGSAAAAIKQGKFVSNWGKGKVAFITRHDCAAAAAVVLSTPGHADKLYNLTGAQLLSARELAAIFGRVGGRTVEPVLLDDAAFARLLEAGGTPPAFAQLSVQLGDAIRRGSTDVKTSSFEQLVGQAPTSLEDYLLAHASELK